MKSRFFAPVVAAVLGSLLVSACGHTTAASTPSSKKVVRATAVPAPLAAFASFSDPILRTSVAEAKGLVKLLPHGDMATLGNECSLVGGDLSSSRTALHSGLAPTGAGPTFKMAESGFKLVLSATDECGIAADASSRSQMKPAISDLNKGIGELSRAESALAHWQSGKV